MIMRYPFFGMLMMGMRFGVDDTIGTAATNGEIIIFDPSFADLLDDNELDFIIMHEIMHVALDHLSRGKMYDHTIFNVACDIVVNSNIMQVIGVNSMNIAGEDVMHLAPDGREGRLYTAEEVYHMIISEAENGVGLNGGSEDGKIDSHGPWSQIAGKLNGDGTNGSSCNIGQIDSHGLWSQITEARRMEIAQQVQQAAMVIGKGVGCIPLGIERGLTKIHNPRLDWREILNEFVQENMQDYSFVRPDNRYSGDFIMPGFINTDGTPGKILFMIDTSGSMLEDEITGCFSEICGAIEQFGGQLCGYLGFFDCEVTAPVPFESVDDVMKTKPIGGGGTSVEIIFEYVRENMTDDPPVSIIILTDGWVYIPKEECSDGIPVLWVLTSDVPAPEWGSCAYIT